MSLAPESTSTRRIADAGVYPIGIGGMGMTTARLRDEERSIRTVHAALDAGANHFDTADIYARDASEIGHNERLLAKALAGRRDDVVLATKGGILPSDGEEDLLDGRPEHIRAACEASLQRARERPDRPLLLPPPRSEGPVRRVGRRVQGAARRGQDPLGRPLERDRRADRGGGRHCRDRGRAEPARARLHRADPQGRGAGLHRPRHRVRAVVAARRRATPRSRTSTRRRSRWPSATASRRSRSRWRGC